jgi:hypothetical protein
VSALPLGRRPLEVNSVREGSGAAEIAFRPHETSGLRTRSAPYIELVLGVFYHYLLIVFDFSQCIFTSGRVTDGALRSHRNPIPNISADFDRHHVLVHLDG